MVHSFASLLLLCVCARVCGSTTNGATFSSYAVPEVQSVTPLSGRPRTHLTTLGGDVVELRGLYFGPLTSLNRFSVLYYSGPSASGVSFPALACNMTEAHTAVRCTTSPGFGR